MFLDVAPYVSCLDLQVLNHLLDSLNLLNCKEKNVLVDVSAMDPRIKEIDSNIRNRLTKSHLPSSTKNVSLNKTNHNEKKLFSETIQTIPKFSPFCLDVLSFESSDEFDDKDQDEEEEKRNKLTSLLQKIQSMQSTKKNIKDAPLHTIEIKLIRPPLSQLPVPLALGLSDTKHSNKSKKRKNSSSLTHPKKKTHRSHPYKHIKKEVQNPSEKKYSDSTNSTNSTIIAHENENQEVMVDPSLNKTSTKYVHVRPFTMQKIGEMIEEEIKNYKASLISKQGKNSIEKRKHRAGITRDFYRWYFKHVTLFMDGYLYPHKELRKNYEEQSILYTLSSDYKLDFPYTREDLQQLSSLLSSYITEDIAFTDTKQTKIRNLILHYGILFQSYLDFMSCMDSEGKFNFVRTQWIQSLTEPPYNTFGKSNRMAIERALDQYKFRLSQPL